MQSLQVRLYTRRCFTSLCTHRYFTYNRQLNWTRFHKVNRPEILLLLTRKHSILGRRVRFFRAILKKFRGITLPTAPSADFCLLIPLCLASMQTMASRQRTGDTRGPRIIGNSLSGRRTCLATPVRRLSIFGTFRCGIQTSSVDLVATATRRPDVLSIICPWL